MNGPERDRLDIIEAKVDRLLQFYEDPDFGVRASLRDHEKRIRSTERWKLSIPITLVLAVLAVIGGAATRGGP
jgi:hypothetical protein